MKLSQAVKQERPQKLLVYGPSKSGKTELVAHLANHGYTLWWFDLESGFETLLHVIKPEFLDNVHLFRIPDTQSNPVAIKTIYTVMAAKGIVKVCDTHGVAGCTQCKANDPWESIEPLKLGPKDVIVIDTVTQLSDSAISKAATGILKTLFTAFDKVDWDSYNHQGMLLNAVFSHMQQLRCNVVCITHEEIIEMTDKSKVIVPVAGTRNYSRRFGRFFGHVVYCFRKNKDHKTASSSKFNPGIMTGSRGNVSMETNGSLLDMLKGIVYTNNDSDPEASLGLIEAGEEDGIVIQEKPATKGDEGTVRAPDVVSSETPEIKEQRQAAAAASASKVQDKLAEIRRQQELKKQQAGTTK